MGFDKVLAELKTDESVRFRRSVWNHGLHIERGCEGRDGPMSITTSYLIIVRGDIIDPWTPNTADMFAEDWQEV